MYTEFYRLSLDPFMISPDYRFSFPHQSYVKAKTYLEYGLMREEGLVIVTGAPGTGKSTVINELLADYDDDDMFIARMLATHFEVDDLLRMLAYSFGINAEGLDKASTIRQIEHFLYTQFDAGRRVLLIIDEAQHLSERALEELRLLTNIQHKDKIQLQIFLLGQPQLKELLKSPDMEQFRQRIIASCEFELLDASETLDYVKHRLRIAGWDGDPEITNDAFGLIHRLSRGVPRQINMLCSRLLLHGSVDQKHRLTSDDVHQVIEELSSELLDDLHMQGSEVVSPSAANNAYSQTSTEKDSLQRVSRSSIGSISALPNSTLVGRQNTSATPSEPQTSKRTKAHDHTDGTSGVEHSISSSKRHDVAHSVAPITDTIEEPFSMIPDAEDSDLEKDRVETSTGKALPSGASKGVDLSNLENPFKPRILRDNARTNAHLRKSRLRRHLLTAVFVFAGVFASSYAYFTWSPNRIEALLPKLRAFIPENIPIPGDGTRDEPSPPSIYASGERETKPSDSNSSLDPHENFHREDFSRHRAKSGPLHNENIGANDPREQNALQSRAELPAARKQINQGDSIAELKVQDNTHVSPPKVAVEFAATEQDGSAPGDVETQEEGLRSQTKPSDEKHMNGARVSRHQTEDTDSGVVEKGGKRVISGDLERALLAHSLHAQRMPDGSVKITLHGAVPSEPDRVRLNTEASRSLEKLAFVLRNYQGFTVQVVANTDENPTDDNHLNLLRRRAQWVAKYLIVHGVPIHRVHSEARGEHVPVAALSNTSYRPKTNHQIEIFLRPAA